MLTRKEITAIIIISLILGFTISLVETIDIFLYTMLFVFLALLINIATKKFVAYYFEAEIEMRIWEFKRYWFKPTWHLKKAFPAGAFFPIITTAFTQGFIVWMGCLVFDVKSKVYSAAKRHDIYKFSEISEWHTGLIAASGVVINLVFGIIGYLIDQPEFAKINIHLAVYNMIPLGDLDGNKIFFGDLWFWCTLAVITLIGLGYTWILI